VEGDLLSLFLIIESFYVVSMSRNFPEALFRPAGFIQVDWLSLSLFHGGVQAFDRAVDKQIKDDYTQGQKAYYAENRNMRLIWSFGSARRSPVNNLPPVCSDLVFDHGSRSKLHG
jgi:hypothetical protein